MIIVGKYSFNDGEKIIKSKYQDLLNEIEEVIFSVNSEHYKTKISSEKTMKDKLLYSPSALNKAYKEVFKLLGWNSKKIKCDYPIKFYTPNYKPKTLSRGAFREMDFVKGKLGVEVQFGKYAFMVYNVCAKMTIFKNYKIIDIGVEIVPIKRFADHMSTGVSYFEQIVWDLEARGVSDIDTPVLVLGVDKNNPI